MKHLRILLTALAVLGLAACHTQSTPTSGASAAVATVNGVPITQQFYDSYIKMISGGRTPSELTPQQRAMVLDGLIRAEAVAQEAVRLGIARRNLRKNEARDHAKALLRRYARLERKMLPVEFK